MPDDGLYYHQWIKMTDVNTRVESTIEIRGRVVKDYVDTGNTNIRDSRVL